jgi:hypothetical protein
METTTIKDKVLNGKNAQSIRATLKARTPKSFEIKNKGKKVSQEVGTNCSTASSRLYGKCGRWEYDRCRW